ncbi:MAG: translation elongation factor Ts [Candidatus Dormibacteria bacterium]
MPTVELIKDLRERTGAGMMDCREALAASGDDLEKAIDWLRQKGLSSAAKRAGRVANQGLVDSYIHANGQVGVLVELNCESDFVGRTDDFKNLAHELALQIAGRSPRWVSSDDVPEEEKTRELEVGRAQAREQGKPEQIWEKIAEGKLKAFFEEYCLLDQKYVRDDKVVIRDLVANTASKLGENVTVRRFARFRIGEE